MRPVSTLGFYTSTARTDIRDTIRAYYQVLKYILLKLQKYYDYSVYLGTFVDAKTDDTTRCSCSRRIS